MANHEEFSSFVATIAALRAPDGCPWDKVQTHESIAHNMIEEAYEAVDAIEANDPDHLREELGDVLLQVVLQSQIASDAGEFTIDDVCRDIDAKIVRRHPHVFGEAQATDASDVSRLWESVKQAERESSQAGDASGEDGAHPGILDGIPKGFPALMQAQKVSKAAAAAGFEWESVDDVWEKVFEEVDELKTAYAQADKDSRGRVIQGPIPDAPAQEAPAFAQDQASAVEMEFGDVLFSLVNVGRKMGIDAESALRASCVKFRHRWAEIEAGAHESGQTAEQLTMDEMQALWERAKKGRP